MSQQCNSIRSKAVPGERCGYRAKAGEEWCGHHAKQKAPVRWNPQTTIEHIRAEAPPPPASAEKQSQAAHCILRAWRTWLAKRCGPLLWARDESNNPYDFFSSDPIAEIPIRDFVSFVDAGKGYCMDSKSAASLIEHAKANKETPLNPFTRAPLPATLYARLQRQGIKESWATLQATTPEQTLSLAVTDLFRAIEDLGYYTDPAWFMDLGATSLMRVYIELADIWFHRAALTNTDRRRIVPGAQPGVRPFVIPVRDITGLSLMDLRKLLVATCTCLVTAASERADRQLGVMYVLGALTLISHGARAANPWVMEMFAPGVTGMNGAMITVAHPSILAY